MRGRGRPCTPRTPRRRRSRQAIRSGPVRSTVLHLNAARPGGRKEGVRAAASSTECAEMSMPTTGTCRARGRHSPIPPVPHSRSTSALPLGIRRLATVIADQGPVAGAGSADLGGGVGVTHGRRVRVARQWAGRAGGAQGVVPVLARLFRRGGGGCGFGPCPAPMSAQPGAAAAVRTAVAPGGQCARGAPH